MSSSDEESSYDFCVPSEASTPNQSDKEESIVKERVKSQKNEHEKEKKEKVPVAIVEENVLLSEKEVVTPATYVKEPGSPAFEEEQEEKAETILDEKFFEKKEEKPFAVRLEEFVKTYEEKLLDILAVVYSLLENGSSFEEAIMSGLRTFDEVYKHSLIQELLPKLPDFLPEGECWAKTLMQFSLDQVRKLFPQIIQCLMASQEGQTKISLDCRAIFDEKEIQDLERLVGKKEVVEFPVDPKNLKATIVNARNYVKPCHTGIWCDICDQNIHGIRYKCTICRDYDLCETCELKHDRSHPLIKLNLPVKQVVDPFMHGLKEFMNEVGRTQREELRKQPLVQHSKPDPVKEQVPKAEDEPLPEKEPACVFNPPHKPYMGATFYQCKKKRSCVNNLRRERNKLISEKRDELKEQIKKNKDELKKLKSQTKELKKEKKALAKEQVQQSSYKSYCFIVYHIKSRHKTDIGFSAKFSTFEFAEDCLRRKEKGNDWVGFVTKKSNESETLMLSSTSTKDNFDWRKVTEACCTANKILFKKVEVYKYQMELKALRSMGFTQDEESLKALLNVMKGDIQKCTGVLLQ